MSLASRPKELPRRESDPSQPRRRRNNPASKVRVPRSQGCRNCVERHNRCDLTRPQCLRCQKAGRQCPGYETTKFVDETSAVEDLYTISGRKSSSNASSSISPRPHGPHYTARPSTQSPAGHKADPLLTETTDWPQSAFERKTLLTLLCPTAYQAQLFSDFIDSTQGPQSAPTFLCHSFWLSELAQQGEPQSTALVWAIRAMGTSHLGRRLQDENLIQSSRGLYGKALVKLNLALQDSYDSYSVDTLSATVLLAFYEVLNCTGPESWLKHVRGASLLMRSRGPLNYRTPIERAVLMAFRYSLIMESFESREPCFLAEPAWRQLCHDICATMPRGQRGFVVTVTEEFFQEIVSYPAYLQHALKTIASPLSSITELQEAISQGITLRKNFQASHARIQMDLNAADLAPTKRGSRKNDVLFPVVYEFPDIQVASIYCAFWTISTGLNRNIVALEYRMNRLTSSSPPTIASPVATSHPIIGQKWANSDHEVLLKRKGPKDMFKPLWNVIRSMESCQQSHPYLAENKNHAREVCKAVEYMAEAPFLGSIVLIKALHQALTVIDSYDETRWIMAKLDSIGDRLAMARSEVEVYHNEQPQHQQRRTHSQIDLKWQDIQTTTQFESG